MRPLEVPRMKKKDLLQRLAEEKQAALEAGSLYDSTYLTYTNSDGTVERRPRVCESKSQRVNEKKYLYE